MAEVISGNWGDKPKRPRDTGDGNPPGGDPMEARVAQLESHVEYIRRDVGEIKTDLKAAGADLVALKVSSAVVDGRLAAIEKNMLTKGQLAAYAVVAAIALIGGTWWIVQQYLSPILKMMPK